MSALQDIKESQRKWAISRSLDPDAKGYLGSVESNLFKPLSEKTRLQFENGSGSELEDGNTRPAKMRALHSSSALAVNFFDHWVDIDKSALQAALGLGQEIISISFEEQFPTGLDGNPPNVDVTLKLSDGHLIGIESKFSEWLTPKTKSIIPFQPKYFPEDRKLWADVGLPESQKLAEAIDRGEENFRYLNTPQLLKHALGMATSLGGDFSPVSYTHLTLPTTPY